MHDQDNDLNPTIVIVSSIVAVDGRIMPVYTLMENPYVSFTLFIVEMKIKLQNCKNHCLSSYV